MDDRPGTLEERVRRLEAENGEIRKELRYALRRVNRLLAQGVRDDPLAPSTPPTTITAQEPGTSSSPTDPRPAFGGPAETGRRLGRALDFRGLRSGEWWLNKVGIGLLLLGVAFLFMLAVERGWIGPYVRVGFGLAVGGTLLALGMLLHERRRAFSQVLLGGGVGALYTSGFAAFQLYGLFSYPVALVFMVGVTALAFGLALRQDGVSLSLIGAIGGLGTPFLLYTDSGTLGGLVLYTCLLLVGAVGVYLYRGWAALLAVSFAGGWAVFLIGYADSSLLFAAQPLAGERPALQIGVTLAWLLFSCAPTARGFMRETPVSGATAALGHTVVISGAFVALGFTEAIWWFSTRELGWISLSGTILYGLAALALRHIGNDRSAYVHAIVSLLLLTLTLALFLREGTLLLTLAVEATALHFLAQRFSDRIVSVQAHLLSFVAAVWLAGRLMGGILDPALQTEGPALLNVSAVLDLAVVATGFASSLAVWPRRLDLAYRIAAHAALLALLWRELSGLPGGDAWVTVAWGLYAVGLLAAGIRFARASLVRGGMATLFVVVGKLFLVDLSEVEPVLRVALFLGFGGLFLAISYFLQGLWRPDPRRPSNGVTNGASE